MRIAAKSISAIKEKIREHTRRNRPVPLNERTTKLKEIIHGWVTISLLRKQRVKWLNWTRCKNQTADCSMETMEKYNW
ncbi:group II intron maturase-specific domain-containing protein [Algibacter miyuki]|uniref:group II intron maturase-specific domain-containing protein n=1 Tax=Algibacter miyuki TaxID=1306933 RepID=UPI003AFF7470